MYPSNVPAAFAEQSNQNSLEFQTNNVPVASTRKRNISYALKKVRPDLAGDNKCGVKPVSNIKTDQTHKDWYLACEAY